jgi:hypothetical protein
MTIARASTCTLAVVLAASSLRAAGGPLSSGNEAFRAGRFEEAAKIYETEDEGSDLLTRRFNAGVSWERAGSADKALERFEDVSARADGELRASAFYNAGHAAFGKASAIAVEAETIQDADEKARKLVDAANAFRSSAQFFRSVEPPDAATSRNIAATKTALRAVLDQIAQIEAEKKKKAEDEALKSPAELLRAIAEKEKTHRGLARALAKEEAQKVRLGSRRLRKSEAENRALAEKLQHHLTEPPPAPATPPQGQPPAPSPGPSDEEKARNTRAAEAVGRAIEAQKDAELAYAKLDATSAVASHTRAVGELRSAIEAFPLDIATVIGEALSGQETVNGAMDSLAKTAAGGVAPETKGAGMGKKIVDAIKDKVLLPLAKLVAPKGTDDAKPLADDEDDVVWGANIIAQAEIKPPEAPPAQPGAPVPPGHPPQLTPEQAKELSEGLRHEGKTAHEESSKAKESLAAGDAGAALPHGKEALEALKRAAELLPKPPKPPEERLKELIEKQKGARQATDALATLADAARDPASKELARTQRIDGKEAADIGDELEKMGADPASGAQPHPAADNLKEAVKKVREGGEKIFSSAELLAQKKEDDAKAAIDRDVALLEEALALLQGKDQKKDDEKKDEQKKQDQEKQQEKKQDSGQEKKKKEGQKPYALSPRDARLKQQEMDRKRREQEAKIFSAPSTMTVEKDW